MEQAKTQPEVCRQVHPTQNPGQAAQPVHRPTNKKSKCPLLEATPFRGCFTQHYDDNVCVIL